MACFSEGQLKKFAGPKRISQETFDAAVQENIDEFGLEPDEALQSAVDEFTAQGVDLSNIIKTVAGGDVSAHPAARAVEQLQAAAAAGDAAGAAAAADAIADALRAASGADGTAEAAAVLHRAGAPQVLVQAGAACSEAPAELLRVLCATAAVLGASRDLQAGFLQAGGAAWLHQVLESHAGDAALAAAALQAAAAAAAKNEEGKAALVAADLGGASLAALERHADSPEALSAACATLCALTNPDDDTVPASRAFPNARALAKAGAAQQLVAALRRHEALPRDTTAALATALKQVAANDDICQEVAAAGGVQLALHILRQGLEDAAVARPLCALLRQLASSDSNKELLLQGGGLELLGGLLAAHGGSPAVLEQALGLLANATLRYPEAAVQAAECGCLDSVVELMQAQLAAAGSNGSNGKARGGSAVQRQACMALRNMAVRSPEVRAALLDKGAEGLLRTIKTAYPSSAEFASAALRDLGVDDYNA